MCLVPTCFNAGHGKGLWKGSVHYSIWCNPTVNMKIFISAIPYYGQSRMFKMEMNALVISYLVLGRTSNVLPGLQHISIHHNIILFRYYLLVLYLLFFFFEYKLKLAIWIGINCTISFRSMRNSIRSCNQKVQLPCQWTHLPAEPYVVLMDVLCVCTLTYLKWKDFWHVLNL